jgi:hypothetical protein
MFGTKIRPIVATPTITSPANGATGLEPLLTLQCTPFTMAQGSDTRASTTWEISTNPDFTNIVEQVTY